MSWWELLLIPLGFAVGAYGTIVGAGGGFVLVPVLLILYPDEDPASITAISLMVVFFNAASGSAAYARAKRIDYLTGVVFALATIPGAIGGAFLVAAVPRQLFDLIFALLLFALGGYTMWGIGRPMVMRPPLRGRGIVTRVMPAGEEGATFQYSYNMWQGIAYSAGVGFISSLLGIGGGVIHVPVMITLLRIPVHVAVATSHFVLAVMSGTGTIVHLSTGTLAGDNLIRSVLISLGAVPGAQVGARIAHRLHGVTIARLLMVALFALGLRQLWSGVTG
jgi:uncharacterized membrane protein YfcA